MSFHLAYVDAMEKTRNDLFLMNEIQHCREESDRFTKVKEIINPWSQRPFHVEGN